MKSLLAIWLLPMWTLGVPLIFALVELLKLKMPNGASSQRSVGA